MSKSKIGFVGLGKLGLPVALTVQTLEFEVLGYDIDPKIIKNIEDRVMPYKEEYAPQFLKDDGLKTGTLEEVVKFADIVFCAVQTPHEPQFEGTQRLPEEREDFDYAHLKKAVESIVETATKLEKKTTLVVISTCLPGTYKREIKPLLNKWVNYVYNPFFIAMGTVVYDFLNPEFVLMGGKSKELQSFYRYVHNRPHLVTDITTAEAIKVSYNTFITMKTVLANTWGEIAYKTGANVDDIYLAWSLAKDRLISSKYLKSGMGDGGGCHPRDNIALSWLAKDLDLSHDIFEDLMKSREDHAEWLAKMIPDGAVIFGRSFKPETRIETGSPALLVANILKEQGKTFTHEEDPVPGDFNFIATKHARYQEVPWPKGSTVLDPFGYIPSQAGVNIVRIGRI